MSSRLDQARTVMRLRRRLRRRPDPERALAALRRHAAERSPYYRRLHGGSVTQPLAELPVVTKDDLVEHFDDITVDRELSLAVVESFLRDAAPGDRLLGRYRVGVSSGSSGRPAALAFDDHEWVALLANAARARAVARPTGAGQAPPNRRSAKISSPSPWHLSAQVGATLADPRRPVLRLPATTPLPELVEQLDDWQPATLTAYASVLGRLADEQIDGRLHIAPVSVFSGAELLTDGVRRRARDAWGLEPIDQYVTTEAGFVATDCWTHDGMHVLDDHVVLEIVDDRHRPVPDGEAGSRALVTVLSSRTVPLVRYELTDSLRRVPGPCGCGRSSPRIVVLGRARELVRLQGAAGPVDVHPVVFTQVMDRQRIDRWQVRFGPGGAVTVLISGGDGVAGRTDDIATAMRCELERVTGASPAVRVEAVDDIARGAGGKSELVVVDRAD